MSLEPTPSPSPSASHQSLYIYLRSIDSLLPIRLSSHLPPLTLHSPAVTAQLLHSSTLGSKPTFFKNPSHSPFRRTDFCTDFILTPDLLNIFFFGFNFLIIFNVFFCFRVRQIKVAPYIVSFLSAGLYHNRTYRLCVTLIVELVSAPTYTTVTRAGSDPATRKSPRTCRRPVELGH